MLPGSLLTSLAVDVAQTLRDTAAAALLHPLDLVPAPGRTTLRHLPAAPGPAVAGQGTPVVLVHGFGGNAATWSPLERRLRSAGFTSLHVLAYSPFTRCLSHVARGLVRHCHEAMHRAGTDQVHLIGYSLGGVVVRYAVQELGLEPRVRTAVTVATPHRGTLAALLGRGTVAAGLLPGSRILEDLRRRARPSSVRWVSYFSDRDLVVRPWSSRLDEPPLRATNVLVPGAGHLGIVRSPLFLASVVHLLGSEGPEQWPAGPAARTSRRADAAA